jgi:hypothetical protein
MPEKMIKKKNNLLKIKENKCTGVLEKCQMKK